MAAVQNKCASQVGERRWARACVEGDAGYRGKGAGDKGGEKARLKKVQVLRSKSRTIHRNIPVDWGILKIVAATIRQGEEE